MISKNEETPATYATKDSGERKVFDTGAQRDIESGKPRYDLIPTFALKRLAELYARGAEKYREWNWTEGIPYSRMLSSAERHLQQWKQGDRDEDHLAAVAWNILGLIHYEEVGRDDLDDLPRFDKNPRGWQLNDVGGRIPWPDTETSPSGSKHA